MGSVKKTKKVYKYSPCSACGTKSREDLATLYVTVADGRTVAVPDVRVHVCKKCKKLVIAPETKSVMKEMVDEVLKSLDSKGDGSHGQARETQTTDDSTK